METTLQVCKICCEECCIMLQKCCTNSLHGCQKICKGLLQTCQCFRETCLCGCNRECLSSWCPKFSDFTPVHELSVLDRLDEDFEDKKPATPKLKEDSKIREVLSSFVAFFFGLLLTSLYGFTVLLLLNYNLYFCIVTTLIIGFFLSLGMAFYPTIRVTVLLMLPHLLSARGKYLIMAFAISLCLKGPVANTADNLLRVTGFVRCGVEVAINKTEDTVLALTKPLLRFADSIKKLAKGFKKVGDKANEFLDALSFEMKHIGRTLHRAWDNLYNLQEICDEFTGAPDKKCFKIFKTGKDKCLNAMGKAGFLCNTVDAVSLICHVPGTPCLVPAIIQRFARSYKSKPVQWMIKNFKEQFAFNITMNKDFDINFNSSKSLFQAALDVKKEIENLVAPYREMISMFTYFVFFMILYIYIKALWYRTHYLFDDNFDNIYITRNFVELDVMRGRRGAKTLLPLTYKESKTFVRPASLALTKKEKVGRGPDMVNIFRILLFACCFMCMDYSVYWILAVANYVLKGDLLVKVSDAPNVRVNGNSFFRETIHSMVDSYNTLYPDKVKSVSQNCLAIPLEPNYSEYRLIAIVLALAFFVCTFGAYIERLKHSICAYYYPFREQQRICFLYNTLMSKRMSKGDILLNLVRRTGDEGHTNLIDILASKFPWMSKFQEAKKAECCVACAKICSDYNSFEFRPCLTSGCKGLYCRDCTDMLCNTCMICMMPFIYEDNIDVEMDSSDEEEVLIWMHIRKNTDKTHTLKRSTLKKRIEYTASDVKTRAKRGSIKYQQLLEKMKDLKEDCETSESDTESTRSSDSE
ncbi:hypothetical protein XENTR_v10008236 [Xenopus tropicalis]|nr:hypothetical protein XENTR_v10008236 [Xenopus tropicalis]